MRVRLGEAAAVQAAAATVNEYGFTRLPVCPFDIARRLGFVVASRDYGERGVTGCLMRVGNEFGIYYSSHIDNDGLIRFTVAHELGHYFLPGHVEALFASGTSTHLSRGGFVSKDRYERQADRYASALLMPRHLFVPALQETDPGLPAVQTLSEKCRTSLTATAIRYAKLAEDAVAVIVSSNCVVDYCFLSEPLRNLCGPSRLRRGDPLPPRSASARVTKAHDRTGSQAAYASLDEWFDGAPQLEIKEDAQALGGYGKTLTVLFADELASPDEDEDW